MEKPEVKGGEATSGKSCKSCKVVKSAAGFSKKQFKAPENVRKCLVCMGLSDETGVPGLRIGDSVRLHSLQAAEYNGLAGKIVAALNERGRLGVKVEKAGGEDVMAFLPKNVSKIMPSGPNDEEIGIADPDPRQHKVLRDDAMTSFANVMFSIKEKFGERASDAREIVARMARMLDEFKGGASLGVQQDDEQAGVLLHPMYPAAEAPGSKAGTDFTMLCIFRAVRKSEPNLQRTLNQFTKLAAHPDSVRHDMKSVHYPTEAVKDLVRVLEANAQKFESSRSSDPQWRAWYQQFRSQCGKGSIPDPSLGFTLSYVSASDFAPAGASSDKKHTSATCNLCGKPGAEHRCRRCGQIFYCSKACQAADWEAHKPACKRVSKKLEGGDVVTADVTIAPPGMEGMLYSTMNLNAPVAKSASGKSAFDPPKRGETPVSRNDGSTCVIKIQIGPVPATPMMVYDRKKQINFMLHAGNAGEDGCLKIFKLICEKGEAGGRKGYFNCQVEEGGTKVLILVDTLLPLQNW